jgi:hypothetical protein
VLDIGDTHVIPFRKVVFFFILPPNQFYDREVAMAMKRGSQGFDFKALLLISTNSRNGYMRWE